jgi:hypothetical protein
MTGNNAFQDRKRESEEEYFHKKDYELIEKMRRAAELDAEKERMAEIIGIDDPEILNTLAVMGFTPNTARLIFLTPLVQTAWAGGRVTLRQRRFIYEAARSHEIDEHGPAGKTLSEWFERQPSDAFFELALRVIRNILHFLPPDAHESRKRQLLQNCERVATASRMLFIRKVGRKPPQSLNRLIEHFSQKLERQADFRADQENTPS